MTDGSLMKVELLMSNVVDQIARTGLVAVARTESANSAIPLVGALLAGGVNIVEFTLSHRSALGSLEQAADHWGEQALLGMGTVLDPESARSAILAGARFIVSPSLNVGVIEMCRRYSIPVFPGALTPTEIVNAWQAGADVVKIFPASVVGPRYLRELKGPFPSMRFMPTGGIGADNLGDYLQAGAVAVGIGSNLVSPALVQAGDWTTITARARTLVETVAAARKGS